jgi:hypothetical protein
MTKTHKKQHTIPRSYLASWLESVTPAGQTAAIHLISKEDQSVRRKAPVKTFTETDRYTVTLKNGGRDLSVENGLGQIESDFQGVLRAVREKQALGTIHRLKLAVFTSAMLGRSKRQGDWMKAQWQQLQDDIDKAVAEGRKPPIAEELEVFLTNHHAHLVLETIDTAAPRLFAMGLRIFTTNDPVGFITSDAPAVMYNPEAYRFPPHFRGPGLDQREIEVTLPLTPRHFAMYSHTFPLFSYATLDKPMVDELNRRTAAYAQSFIVSRTADVNPHWFSATDRPADAWENLSPEEQNFPEIGPEADLGSQLGTMRDAHKEWWRRIYRHDPWAGE